MSTQRKDRPNKNATNDKTYITGPSFPGRTDLLKKQLRTATGRDLFFFTSSREQSEEI